MTTMAIRGDALQALNDWKAGKPVRAIELGHTQRQIENPGGSPRIDQEHHYPQDQQRAYAYCFHIIESFVERGAPADHKEFEVICRELEARFRKENAGLTWEELWGAESLAWKALLIGWTRATAGHKDEYCIQIQKPEQRARRG